MKTKLLAITTLILTLTQLGAAQNILDIECYYNAKAGMNGIHVADVNGDGKNEIIAASYDGNIYLFDAACNKLWAYYAACPAYTAYGVDINHDGKTEAVGGNCQHIILIDAKGELIWKYRTGMTVVRITSGDIDGDGNPEIITGSDAPSGTSSILDIAKSDGDAMWGKTYKGSKLHGLLAADINGDGKDEVITGTSKVNAYNSSGDTIWTTQVNGNVEVLHRDDINKDGRQEILVGARPTAYLLDNNGAVIWSFDSNDSVEDMTAYDINSDREKEVLVGSDKLYAVDGKGNLLWSYSTGNKIHKLLVDDLDSDGIPELIAGSDMLYVLSPDGVLLWKYRTYRDVTGLEIDNGTDKRLIASALDRNVYVFKAAKKEPASLAQPVEVTTTTQTKSTTTTMQKAQPQQTPSTTTTTTTNPIKTADQPNPFDSILLTAIVLIIMLAIIYFTTNKIRGIR